VRKERAVPFVSEFGEFALRRRHRRRHVVVIAGRRRPFHLCLAANELASEVVLGILDVRPASDTGPADLERDDARRRGGTAAKKGVFDGVKVEDRNVACAVDSITRARVHTAYAVRRQAGRPEEAARCDAWIEINQLQPRTGVVDVDSYESKCSLPRLTVDASVDAVHKPHV